MNAQVWAQQCRLNDRMRHVTRRLLRNKKVLYHFQNWKPLESLLLVDVKWRIKANYRFRIGTRSSEQSRYRYFLAQSIAKTCKDRTHIGYDYLSNSVLLSDFYSSSDCQWIMESNKSYMADRNTSKNDSIHEKWFKRTELDRSAFWHLMICLTDDE